MSSNTRAHLEDVGGRDLFKTNSVDLVRHVGVDSTRHIIAKKSARAKSAR